MGTHGIAAAPAASIVPAEGSEGSWTPELLDSLEKHLEWLDESVPALPTIPVQEEPQEHREKDASFSEYMLRKSLVAKNIPIREAVLIPEAKAALDKEWSSLWSMKTWLVETVAEFDEIRNKASKEGRTLHFGRVFPISTLKGSELAKGDLGRK